MAKNDPCFSDTDKAKKRISSLPRFKAQKNRSHTALFLASCVASGYVLVYSSGLCLNAVHV